MIATGTFDVKMTPRPSADPSEVPWLGRMRIDKTFEGDLIGTSLGQMLSSMSSVKGSAGYVAIERFVGTLAGQAGAFVLQHSGTMDRGNPNLTVTVVPDSGTGALQGIAGSMRIDRVDGKHVYTFDYYLNDIS